VTLYCYEHYDAALLEATNALKDADDANRFLTLTWMARIQLNLKQDEEAYSLITDALLHARSTITPSSLRGALVIRAEAETRCGKFERAAISYKEARLVCASELVSGNVLQATTRMFEEMKNWSGLINTLKSWTLFERMQWMTWDYCAEEYSPVHSTFREAAAKTKELDFLVHVYGEVIQQLDEYHAGAPIRWELAIAHIEIREDYGAAKSVLNEILDGESTGQPYAFTTANPKWILLCAINLISDIIYEEFRSSRDRERKKSLLEEIKGLKQRRLARYTVATEADTNHHMLIMAMILRKMGPVQEYYDTLDKAFNVCYEALTDGVSWNDGHCLQELAAILAELGGLDKEALTVFSAGFSRIVPEDIPKGDGYDSDYEEINWFCDGECDGVEWKSWDGPDSGPYSCIICYDSVICEDCYQRRQLYNSDEHAERSWRNFCGKNHRYIKGPIKGWEGIKNGVMTIEGEEPIKFRDWLDNLKEIKWKKAWEEFWEEERRLPDIFGEMANNVLNSPK
jgi:tetratricopeptide (TPR) repeat protein